MIPPMSEVTISKIEGPGCINHIWMTQFCREIMGSSVMDIEQVSCVAPVYEINNALRFTWEKPDPIYYRKILF